MPPASSSLLVSLAKILGLGLTAYLWIVIIRAVISWFNPNPFNPLVRFLYRITDPILYYIRRLLPAMYRGIDFSPLILIFIIIFANDFLVTSLTALGKGYPASVIPMLLARSILQLLQSILFLFMILFIIRAVLSWISPDPYNPIVRFIYGLTEPFLVRLRRFLPLVFRGLDFTPLAVGIGLYFLISFIGDLMTSVLKSLYT
ncbi:MAG: YggT family protein [Pseudomonadota bacterium]